MRNEGIFNVIITTPQPVFTKFIETAENRHTSEYISEQIIKVIKTYGPLKFSAFITDNAANMIKSGQLIRNKYPNIIHLTCLAHTLNLIVGDFMKCASISKLMATIITYVKTIKHSQLLTAILSNIRSACDVKAALQLPVKTRWGSVLQCIEAFLKNK